MRAREKAKQGSRRSQIVVMTAATEMFRLVWRVSWISHSEEKKKGEVGVGKTSQPFERRDAVAVFKYQ